jgi:hypothetical protein
VNPRGVKSLHNYKTRIKLIGKVIDQNHLYKEKRKITPEKMDINARLLAHHPSGKNEWK